ncbi:cytochrome c1 [Candidatus Venteria ishoeyi]|uniref:cytochrome c1 n=1 Tax=Candidatus Venteria ishoeyi TaxID=1899563 RepID=UPI0025A587DF|nr:cytochrome c1 [Candidatus Venteria ishoeyi]MDM8546041.1 cytochrome c1 [Candidatus Venteria ishoeyi]
MKKLLPLTAFFSALLSASVALAGGGGAHLMHVDTDMNDQGSLQNGAKLFVNYCLSCHSASFMRFNRMGKDLGLTDEQVKENLMFTTDKVGNTMEIAMDSSDAERWFGVTPPDLSVISRARGSDWLYTYFLSFYKDDSKPLGINNLVFKDVGMPHVLGDLQGGIPEPVYKTVKDDKGHEHQVIEKVAVPKGSMSDSEYAKLNADYERNVRDLVNFLEYMGEPAKMVRYSLGVKVILFLLLLFIFAFALKKEYWKDIH